MARAEGASNPRVRGRSCADDPQVLSRGRRVREVRGGEPGALRGDAWTAGSCGRPARRTQRPAPPQKCLRLKPPAARRAFS